MSIDHAEIGYDMGKQAAGKAMAELFTTLDIVPEHARMAATVMALGTLRFLIDGMVAWHQAHAPAKAKVAGLDIERDVEGIHQIMKEDDPDFINKIEKFKRFKATQGEDLSRW
jgi:hypothetical protein